MTSLTIEPPRTRRSSRPVSTPAVGWARHVDALDGVRGIAILLVFVFHFGLWASPQSAFDSVVLDVSRGLWAGVDLFFVLSGFLITGILLDSRADSHYFRNFYARRTLRIFPLYYGVLFALILVLPLAIPRVRSMDMVSTLRANQLWFWTYLTNVRVAAIASWDPMVPGRLNHFWSLAVEEQFYLIWPFVVLISGPRRLLRICGIVIGVACVSRGLLLIFNQGPVGGFAYTEHLAGYVLLPARADSLAIGAAIACLVRADRGYEYMRHIARPLAVVSGAALLVIAFADHRLSEYDAPVQVIGYPLLAIFFAAFIVVAIDPAGGWVRRVCEWRVLRRIGTYAYAIYIFHYPIAYFLTAAGVKPERFFPSSPTIVPGLIAFAAIGFAITYVIAAISWRFYEAPFLKLKRFFVRDEERVAEIPAEPALAR